MTKRFLLLFAAVAMLCAAGCESLPSAPSGNKLTVTPATLSFRAEGGQAKVGYSAPAAWTAEVSVDWISFVGDSSGASGAGTITLEAQANPTTDPRAATFTIKSGSDSQQVSILQDAGKQVEPDPDPVNSIDGHVNDWSDDPDPDFEKTTE